MTQEELINVLIVFSYTFLGAYVMMFTEFREPRRVWRLRWAVTAELDIAANGLLCAVIGRDIWMYCAVFTLTIPIIIITVFCSLHKGLRVVFSVCTCLWVGCVAFSCSETAYWLSGGNLWIRLAVHVAAYVALYFVLCRFRPYYKRMVRLLDHGWSILCMIPTVTFLVALYIINFLLTEKTMISVIAICGITIICTCAYSLIYLFFVKVLDDYELKTSSDLAEVRRFALERQLEETREAENLMRVQRRDMSCRWMMLSSFVEKNDTSAIAELIGGAQKKLDESVSVVWCKNQMLNATVAAYFTKAKREGITVEAKLDIPDDIPVDAAELSMVFANALENAINACTLLPPGKRKIICKCVEYPRFMLKVENTYNGKVRFGSDGLPLSSEDGHGIGTRSIAAFCKKYDASWSYDASDGWFTLRIAL